MDTITPVCVLYSTSLEITGGADGSRLTHTHGHCPLHHLPPCCTGFLVQLQSDVSNTTSGSQYRFVLQTLNLWRNVLHNMYKLWMLAEEV